MIEWCGVMTEYVKMLEQASKDGLDPRNVDKHHSANVTVPAFMIDYFCEKLGCQLIPFIRGNPAQWRTNIDGWFKETQPAIKSTSMTHTHQESYPNIIVGSGTNPLIVEGAGWAGAANCGPIGNPRIRTRIKCPAFGDALIYFEAGRTADLRGGVVMHCFQHDCNERSIWRSLESKRFVWDVFSDSGESHAYGLLKLINDSMQTQFDSLHVINDGSICVHHTKEALC